MLQIPALVELMAYLQRPGAIVLCFLPLPLGHCPSSQGLQLSLLLTVLNVYRCVEIPAANYTPRLHTLAMAELLWKATLVMLLLTS